MKITVEDLPRTKQQREKDEWNEHRHQVELIRWCDLMASSMPDLRLIFAIANGGHRSISVAKKLKAEGVKAGVLDLFLPVPRGEWHGMFIEMKAGRGRMSTEQKAWAAVFKAKGYRVEVCHSWMEASKVLEAYLTARTPRPPA